MKNFMLGLMATLSASCILWLLFWAKPSLPEFEIRRVPDSAKKLGARRIQILKELETIQQQYYQQGLASQESLLDASQKRLQAELEMETAKAARIKILEQQLENARTFEAMTKRRVQAGVSTRVEMLRVEMERLDLEIEIEREKARTR